MILTGKKAPSNKTPDHTKSMNMVIWVVGESNQLFISGSLAETKFLTKKNLFTGKTPFLLIGPFCTHHRICLNIGF